jgi:outer membrane protein OmpA-like peptidoglycan-associated protein
VFGSRIVIKRGSKDEAEKPFWISFSDLMSALMVLFLVVMAAALLSKTQQQTDAERVEAQKAREIALLLSRLKEAATKFSGVSIDNQVINFGERARFAFGRYQLSPADAAGLRAFVPEVLAIANTPEGQRWFKRIVVEGFTDQRGTYLFNLNLSLQRSQEVVCVLLAEPPAGESPLSIEQKEQIRDLFLVGGYSFNSAKERAEDSRRIEWRLEFYDDPQFRVPQVASGEVGTCAI